METSTPHTVTSEASPEAAISQVEPTIPPEQAALITARALLAEARKGDPWSAAAASAVKAGHL